MTERGCIPALQTKPVAACLTLPDNEDAAMTPPLVWGLFPRLLGLVYLIAFASLLVQAVPLAGADGVTPIKPLLRKIREDYPLWRCLLGFPTLLWIRSDDWCLRGLVVLAMAGA